MTTARFRVLAVDDDPDILDLIKMSLERDYDVIALTDPSQALDFLEYVEPDIAVLDIMMPKVTGYHIVEELRSKPQMQGVQVIFLSAKNSPHDIRYGYKVGANYYLTKPFMPDRLRRTVEIVLSEGLVRAPRPKTWSLREVQMRLQMKIPRLYESWEEFQAERERLQGKDNFKLKRPLSTAKPKEKEDRWEG